MEKAEMKLSIIVPVYNVKDYIRPCLDSLLAQRMEDFELILIDDGSTDGTAAILEGYAAKHGEKIVLRRVENGGQGRARNIAMDMARGEYIGFIDSDDWISPDMYPKLIAKAEEEGADIAFCDWMAVDAQGGERFIPAGFQKDRLSVAGSACNKLFRRELIEDIRFPAGLWYEDFYFSAIAVLKAKSLAYVKEPLYFYRQSQSSTMRNQNSAKNLDLLRIMDMLANYMLPEGYESQFDMLLINHVLLDAINRVYQQHSPDKAQVLKELRAYVRKRIPELGSCPCYREESRNRRLIMSLNYAGMYWLSAALLSAKKRLSKG